MSDTASTRNTLRITTCDTDETLAAASDLFNQYRHHYGQPSNADERTLGWLIEMVRSNMLTVYTASVDSPVDAPPVGLATAHSIPASLVMGLSWQLRDLYVLPGLRRHGAGAALVSAVREAALASSVGERLFGAPFWAVTTAGVALFANDLPPPSLRKVSACSLNGRTRCSRPRTAPRLCRTGRIRVEGQG